MARLIDTSLIFDAPQLRADRERITRAYLTAARAAVSVTTKALERELEAITRAAVPGQLWKAWKSEVHPKRGLAREPAATIFVNGGTRSRGAIDFFTTEGRIKSKTGGYLAVPLPAAGRRKRMIDKTTAFSPAEWERQNGVKLRYVHRGSKPALLVADLGRVSAAGRFRRATVKQAESGRTATVPIFILIPNVAHPNSVSVGGVLAGADGRLAREFEQRVTRVTDVAGG